MRRTIAKYIENRNYTDARDVCTLGAIRAAIIKNYAKGPLSFIFERMPRARVTRSFLPCRSFIFLSVTRAAVLKVILKRRFSSSVRFVALD